MIPLYQIFSKVRKRVDIYNPCTQCSTLKQQDPGDGLGSHPQGGELTDHPTPQPQGRAGPCTTHRAAEVDSE